MKKSLLKVIALNLAVLMLLSMPFAAFAEGPIVLTVGENEIVNEIGEEAVFNAVFTPEEDGYCEIHVNDNALEVYDGETLLGSVDFYEYESVDFFAKAGKTYTLKITDDYDDGIDVSIYLEDANEVADGGVLAEGKNLWYLDSLKDTDLTFTPDEPGIYNFEYYNDFVDDVVLYNDETVLDVNSGWGGCTFELEAGTTYYLRQIMISAEENAEYEEEDRFVPAYQRIDIKKYILLTEEEPKQLTEGQYAYVAPADGVYNFGTKVYSLFDYEDYSNLNSYEGNFVLEKGKTYTFSVGEDELCSISKTNIVVNTLVLDGAKKPAGYYSYTAPKDLRLASDCEFYSLKACYYEGNNGDKYIYRAWEDQTSVFYVDKEFTVEEHIETVADFYYEEHEDYVEIYGYNGESKKIEVPATINGKPVTYVSSLIDEYGDDGYEVILPEADHTIVVGALNYRTDGLAALTVSGSVEFENVVSYASSSNLALRVKDDVTDLDIFGSSLGWVGHVFYEGTQEEWDALADGVYALNDATVHVENTSGYTVKVSEHRGDLQISCPEPDCGYVKGCLHENESESLWAPEDACWSCTEVYCEDCGYWLYDKDYKTEHVMETLTLIPNTCGKASVAYKSCKWCEEWENNPAAATGKHTLGDWVTTLKPTYEAAGKKVKVCSVCKQEVETQEIAKLTKAATVFTDVTEKNWYHDAVSYAYSKNLFKGVTETTFGPGKEMTRGMLVTVLWRYAGEPKGATHSFSDVPDGKYYSEAVAWAASNGIVTGVTADRFNPNGIVTRAQMATILYRYSQSIKVDTTKVAAFDAFPDGADVKNWAKEGMAWAVAEGLITGSKNNGVNYLVPQNGATRAQVATILMRYIENIVEA